MRTDLLPPAQWVGGIFVGCKKRNDSEEGYIGNARQIRMPEGEMGKFSQDKTSRKNNGLRNRLLLSVFQQPTNIDLAPSSAGSASILH